MNEMLAIALLIGASACFAMAEIGIAASRKIKLRVLAGEGSHKAQDVLDLQQDPGAFFAMIQIALNAISILGGIIGEEALTPYVKEALSMVYQGACAGSDQLCSVVFLYHRTLYSVCRPATQAYSREPAGSHCRTSGDSDALGDLYGDASGCAV